MIDRGGRLTLQDTFRFAADPAQIEEAFVTWCDVQVNGAVARVRGEQHTLVLTIESPGAAEFELERMEEASRENSKSGVLRRLTARLPAQREAHFKMRMDMEEA